MPEGMNCHYLNFRGLGPKNMVPHWWHIQKLGYLHTRGQVFLCSLAFIKRRLEIQKVKSTANASKKIKTNHHKAFCTTHRHLSHP